MSDARAQAVCCDGDVVDLQHSLESPLSFPVTDGSTAMTELKEDYCARHMIIAGPWVAVRVIARRKNETKHFVW
jgi:hypothetical protein